ncbi:hypothetical protein J6590_051751 [Homalodisca vitripennis]|nr:hypothetical protein J6590_051751 [Homalodisca vitripennis]
MSTAVIRKFLMSYFLKAESVYRSRELFVEEHPIPTSPYIRPLTNTFLRDGAKISSPDLYSVAQSSLMFQCLPETVFLGLGSTESVAPILYYSQWLSQGLVMFQWPARDRVPGSGPYRVSSPDLVLLSVAQSSGSVKVSMFQCLPETVFGLGRTESVAPILYYSKISRQCFSGLPETVFLGLGRTDGLPETVFLGLGRTESVAPILYYSQWLSQGLVMFQWPARDRVPGSGPYRVSSPDLVLLSVAQSRSVKNFQCFSGLPETVFLGLGRTEYLSLADNRLTTVPHHVLRLMPILKTLDLGRCKIETLNSGDFQNLPLLRSLILPSNVLTRMDNNSLPDSLRRLHIAHNSLTSLNGTLRNLLHCDFSLYNTSKARKKMIGTTETVNCVHSSRKACLVFIEKHPTVKIVAKIAPSQPRPGLRKRISKLPQRFPETLLMSQVAGIYGIFYAILYCNTWLYQQLKLASLKRDW